MADHETTNGVTDESVAPDPRAVQTLSAAGPPFDSAFFVSILGDRVRAACDGHPEAVPVVELHLADGTILDLCHIPGGEVRWLAAKVYRDRETCEEMDLMFVPYGLVTRITVSMWHRNQRAIGFNLEGV